MRKLDCTRALDAANGRAVLNPARHVCYSSATAKVVGSRGLSLRKRCMANGDHTGHQLALYPSLGQCGTYRSYKHVSPLRQWLDGASGEGTPHRDKAVSTVTKRRSLDERRTNG